MKIIVYTKSNCPNCTTAKRLLSFKKLEFDEVDVEAKPEALRALIELYPSVRQMPQILIDGQRVGGLAGLQAALHQLGK
jgi:glutaredoxin 3